MKKLPKLITPIDKPIMIVGEKMGKQRPGQDTYALEGNGTGDFVHEAVADRRNIILTNVVNYFYPGNFDHSKHVGEGIIDLINLIETYNPRKIICLGNISRDYIAAIKIIECPVVNFPHPSWVNRFHRKDRHLYIKQLSYELDK